MLKIKFKFLDKILNSWYRKIWKEPGKMLWTNSHYFSKIYNFSVISFYENVTPAPRVILFGTFSIDEIVVFVINDPSIIIYIPSCDSNSLPLLHYPIYNWNTCVWFLSGQLIWNWLLRVQNCIVSPRTFKKLQNGPI